eukprot:TRINITY_DN70809_c0_g1_i1.p1 TRINITY_DN70809_c0_g1~~TRINITY_DN70809_c0_g1_i1.p1  ORF type:complete len:227 (-),score=37.20 TRINITY_DN70809_c0_g1_i1:41-721(-)
MGGSNATGNRACWRFAAFFGGLCALLLCGKLAGFASRGSAKTFVQLPETGDHVHSRRHVGAAAATAVALGGLTLGSEAWADDNPWPYEKSRAKISKKLAPFTSSACPDPYIKISLGDAADNLRFLPDKINLVQGCYYELALTNPSSMEHNFIAPDFFKSVYTVVVLAGTPPAELKGQVGELELKPGASLGWFLVPMKSGEFELKCTVKGHTEGGMVGRVTVAPREA